MADKRMRRYRIHWSLHPHKDLEWYEAQKQRMTEDEVARDLDINYAMSVSGKVFNSFSEHKHITKTNPYNPQLPVFRIWDFGRTSGVLWAQIDSHGRKRILHESILEGTDTFEQIHVTVAESDQYFPDAQFEDICDPSGAWSKDGAPSATIDMLNSEGIYPAYERILHLPMKERKKQGRELINKDLQTAPGGQEGLLIYAPDNGEMGCPTLKKAFLGGYRYKKDASGNILDKIHEEHPYEEVMDCLVYLYLETDNGRMSSVSDRDYTPRYSNDSYSSYLGF